MHLKISYGQANFGDLHLRPLFIISNTLKLTANGLEKSGKIEVMQNDCLPNVCLNILSTTSSGEQVSTKFKINTIPSCRRYKIALLLCLGAHLS